MKNNIPESHDINVDPLELKKFNQLAHRWWDQNGEFKPLHEINPLRLNYIERSGDLKGEIFLMLAAVVVFFQKEWPYVAHMSQALI